MSRIAWVVPFALIAIQPVSAAMPEDDAISRYQTLTAVAVRGCSQPHDAREIIVCGRRQADRYRTPFTGYDFGDPRGESVADERERLAADHPLKCGIGAILAGCGYIGVSVGIGGATGKLKLRTPAD